MTEPLPNTPEFTVSELSYSIRRTIEDGFGFVRVRGEISGYRGPHSSGHAYFSLKDESAKIEAVVWRGVFSKLRFRPEEGMEVVATGRVTTFPGGSKYQIVIEALEPAGIGALMALLEERKKKLAAEGLFDEGLKRKLPMLPRVIGVVTSPTGAVIRDILHRLADRFPVPVLVWPVRVQGETSAAEVAAAIAGFNALPADGSAGIPRPDVLIVARGGGSLEDLWSFNEEIVIRAAAASAIPLVSAIGHETDWTLLDLVADLRAPTPTGAAEMVVPVRADLLELAATLGLRLAGAARRSLERRRADLRSAARALPQARDLLGSQRQRLDVAGGRLGQALLAATRLAETRLARISGRLSPSALRRGLRHGREQGDAILGRLRRAVDVQFDRRRALAQRAASRLAVCPVPARLSAARDRLTAQTIHLDGGLRIEVERKRARLGSLAQLLASLSYTSVLKRGFALVRDAKGQPVRSVSAVAAGQTLALQFHDGQIAAIAGEALGSLSAEPAPSAAPRARAPRRKGGDPVDQGSLF